MIKCVFSYIIYKEDINVIICEKNIYYNFKINFISECQYIMSIKFTRFDQILKYKIISLK